MIRVWSLIKKRWLLCFYRKPQGSQYIYLRALSAGGTLRKVT